MSVATRPMSITEGSCERPLTVPAVPRRMRVRKGSQHPEAMLIGLVAAFMTAVLRSTLGFREHIGYSESTPTRKGRRAIRS